MGRECGWPPAQEPGALMNRDLQPLQFKLQHDPELGGHWQQTDRDYPGHQEWQDDPPEAGSHRITASTGNNKALGDLSWNNGVIQGVNVNENWQHKGTTSGSALCET